MKKTVVLIISIILAITSITYAIYNKQNQNYKTHMADQIFMGNLSQARSNFIMDFSKMNDDEKMLYYLQITASISVAMNTINLTSYNELENRNQLFNAVYSLYCCMISSDSRDELITKNSYTVYKYLTDIIKNPQDKKACEELTMLARYLN